MNRKSIILLLYLGFFVNAFSQIKMDNELAQRLSGKTRFYDIHQTVEGYYKEQKQRLPASDLQGRKAIDRQRKFWNRWYWYWKNRVNEDGSFPNLQQKIFDETQRIAARVTAADPSSGNWNLVGPGIIDNDAVGRVDRIAFHPTLPGTLFIGTPSAGLWKTTNFGSSWQNITSFAPTLGVSGIVISFDNPNVIYVLTGDGDSKIPGGFVANFGYIRRSIGVLKSIDGGATWQRTGSFRLNTGVDLSDNNFVGYRLKQHPTDPLKLLAATDFGIFRTSDGGLTWNQSLIGGPTVPDSRVFFDIEYKPGDPSIVYGASTTFFRSTDGGTNFSEVTGGDLNQLTVFPIATRIELAVTPANPSLVYFIAGPGNAAANNFKGVFRSTNSGVSFTRRASTPNLHGRDGGDEGSDQSLYDIAIAAKPTTENTIITGGLVAWKSTDGGITYSEETDYFEDLDDSDWIHPDIHDLAYNPIDPGRLYAATDGGIWVSTDDAFSWSTLNNGLSITQFYKLEKRSENNRPWGGSQDNGVLWHTGSGNVFDDFDGGDGYDVLTDMDQNDKFWVVNNSIRTDGSGDITPPGIDEFFPHLAHDFSPDADKLYAGFTRSFISMDQGSSWEELIYTEGASNIRVPGDWALRSCPSNNGRIYTAGANASNPVGRTAGLWRIDNITTASPNTYIYTYLGNKPGFPAGLTITGIGVHPGNSFKVWITVGGSGFNHVYFSNDAGETWVNITGSLPALPVNCVEVDAAENVFIGTDIGVYFKTIGMSDWSPYYNNLPRVPVTDMEIWSTEGTTYLEAATFGRGIWRSVINLVCVPDLTVNEATIGGQLHYQASNTIQSSTHVAGALGTRVFFRAGNYVQLNSGFEVKAGSNFHAVIGPCNIGGVPTIRAQEPATITTEEKKSSANQDK